MEVVALYGFRWFWGLTCEFWAEIEKNKFRLVFPPISVPAISTPANAFSQLTLARVQSMLPDFKRSAGTESGVHEQLTSRDTGDRFSIGIGFQSCRLFCDSVGLFSLLLSSCGPFAGFFERDRGSVFGLVGCSVIQCRELLHGGFFQRES